MNFTFSMCRALTAEAREIGGEHRLVIQDEAGARISILFATAAGAAYAAAGIVGGRAVDRDVIDDT
ncbi:hypothetical protein [Marinibacterium sp. SX1]|uniref:hypothetical protein n=1 Tax=Marinibacterium sp. SX1 TaxID=3388424 RepID=UPI003D16D605